MTTDGRELQNLTEVQHHLTAIEKPKAAAMVQVPGHQSVNTAEAMGNHCAHKEARRFAIAVAKLPQS